MKNKSVYVLCSISLFRHSFIAGVFLTKKDIKKAMRNAGYSYHKQDGRWYKKDSNIEFYVSEKYDVGELFLG